MHLFFEVNDIKSPKYLNTAYMFVYVIHAAFLSFLLYNGILCTHFLNKQTRVKNSDPMTPREGQRQWRLTPGFTSLFKPLIRRKDGVKEDCGELKIVLKQQNYRVV